MQPRHGVLVLLSLALAACSEAPTAPGSLAARSPSYSGKPNGQGANGCYQVYAGGPKSGGDHILVSGKYNVGNPASVLVAGDCNGGPISFVDDGLRVTLTNPSQQNGGTISVPFYDHCGGHNTGGPAINVTSLFKPGTNTFELTLTDDCGGITFAPALFLVVSQQ